MQKKSFEKIQHPFMIKDLVKLGIEGSCIWQTNGQHYIVWGKLKAFPLNSGMQWGCPLSPLLFNVLLKILARAIRKDEEIKGYK
jgi:hypothetical protein